MNPPEVTTRTAAFSRRAGWLCCALLSAWLLAPTILALSLDSWDGGLPGALSAVFFAVCVFAAPLIFLAQPRRLFLFWLPVAFLVPVQSYLIHLFRSIPGDAFTDSLLRTSMIEMRETLSGFGWLPFVVPVTWLAYAALLQPLRSVPSLTTKQRKGLLALLLAYTWLAAGRYDPSIGDGAGPEVLGPQAISATFPVGPLMSVHRLIAARQERPIDAVKSLRASAPATPQIVILVIGETLRADHLGINGYARNTTPELAKLGERLLTFQDVAATANYTSISVPNIVGKEFPDGTATLISVFREAGYTTAWLSNQDIAVASPNAHINEFTETDWKHGVRYDPVLLPKLAACLQLCGERQFIVLHILGSHFPYDLRYPASAAVFSPTFSGTGAQTVSPRYKQELINSYDNSIIATDRFLADVITQADRQGKRAVVLFTADHGENLYDDERKLVLHSGLKPSRAEAFVPLLLWANDAYRMAHPDKMTALAANRTVPISHVDIMPTLLDLAAISYDNKNPASSVASVAFKPRQRLMKPNSAAAPSNVDTLR